MTNTFDNRKYMIIAWYDNSIYVDRNNLEIYDYDLSKDDIPERINDLKRDAKNDYVDIIKIQICEHTPFIRID